MFDPYGVQVVNEQADSTTQVQNPYTYRFGLYDRATQRYRYGDRQYNPNYGNWAERDTLDSPLDPSNANRYAYAGADPVNNYDPSGLITADVSLDVCLIACLNLGVSTGENGVPHGQVGIGAGAEAGVSVNIGNGSGDVSTGFSDQWGCSGAYYVGGYFQRSYSFDDDDWSTGGGFSGGLGVGCGHRRVLTF